MTDTPPFRVQALRTDGDPALLVAMHKLRARVFGDRLGWGVDVFDGLEIDQFDECDPFYLLLIGAAGQVLGATRMLPSKGPTVLEDVFPQLSDDPVPHDSACWESSRFCVDTAACDAAGIAWTKRGVSTATHALLAGMMEWCLERDIDRIITVTNVTIERILHAARCPTTRLGATHRIENEDAVALSIHVDPDRLETLAETGGLHGAVLMANESEFGFRPEPLQLGDAD